jgi:hypothetical protein
LKKAAGGLFLAKDQSRSTALEPRMTKAQPRMTSVENRAGPVFVRTMKFDLAAC